MKELMVTAPLCAEAQKICQEYAGVIAPNQDVVAKRTKARMLANTVLQDSSSFNSADRAPAKTILDTIDQGVQ